MKDKKSSRGTKIRKLLHQTILSNLCRDLLQIYINPLSMLKQTHCLHSPKIFFFYSPSKILESLFSKSRRDKLKRKKYHQWQLLVNNCHLQYESQDFQSIFLHWLGIEYYESNYLMLRNNNTN